MRTDSVALSDEFVQSVRQYLQGNDPDNLPGKAKKHRARVNAQESHEAIRPTGINHTPDQVREQNYMN